MFLTYVAALALLGFAFRFVLAVIAVPLVLLSATLSRHSQGAVHLISIAFNQGMISVLYAAYIALVTLLFTSSETVSVAWPYFITGMVWVFFALGSNAAGKARETGGLGLWQTPEQQATATGAAIGVLVGLVAYPVFYLVPHLVLVIPGAEWFLTSSFSLGVWLGRFWIVRLILLFTVGGYLLNVGFMALFGTIALLGFLGSRLVGGSAATKT